MTKTCLDTSFLISLANPENNWHAVANEYFYHCVDRSHEMLVSTLAIAEFQIRQDSQMLPLEHFRIMPYNYDHAILGAKYQAIIYDAPALNGDRPIVKNDVSILAQAQTEGCLTILSRDASSLAKWARRLGGEKICEVRPILLKDGFIPASLMAPALDLSLEA